MKENKMKTEITYTITEHALSIDDSVFILEISGNDEDWSMTFNSLVDVYNQIGAFSAKYHLGMKVNTIQEAPVYLYDREAS